MANLAALARGCQRSMYGRVIVAELMLEESDARRLLLICARRSLLACMITHDNLALIYCRGRRMRGRFQMRYILMSLINFGRFCRDGKHECRDTKLKP